LLSALAEVPIKQSLACTGSVNQFGRVQAIGGVNQKIEGYFDICKSRGLNGNQGVLIPDSNVKHLVLRQDVVDAVADGQFYIYPIKTINQGIELLTGITAGTRQQDGHFPPQSVNALVEEKLYQFAQVRRDFSGVSAMTAANDHDNCTIVVDLKFTTTIATGINAAATLAAATGGRVLGLVVQEESMVNLANLPFASATIDSSGKARTFSREQMINAFEQQARMSKKLLSS